MLEARRATNPFVLSAMFATGLLVYEAAAQVGPGVGTRTYSRPSNQVSERIGTIGGPRTAFDVRSFRGGRAGLGQASVPAFGVTRGSAGFGVGRSPFRQQALGFRSVRIGGAGLGYREFNFGTSLRRATGLGGESTLQSATGFSYATDVRYQGDAPKVVTASTPLDTPFMRQSAPPTYFHAFFGLTPTHERVGERTFVETSVAEVMRDQVGERIGGQTQRALEVFARATQPLGELDAEQAAVLLAEASARLMNAAQMLKGDYADAKQAGLLQLLAAHTALLQDLDRIAVQRLLKAVRTYPSLFAEYPNIGRYWGDYNKETDRSPRLHRLLTEKVGAFDVDEESIAAMFLTAYAAAELGDYDRVASVLDRAGRVQLLAAMQEDVLRWRWAVNQARVAEETPQSAAAP
jgi:hypothetical protein